MAPFLVFMLAIILPAMFLTLLFGPFYAGICGSLYLYYGEEIKAHFYDPLYILDLFGAVYYYWQKNQAVLGFSDFLFPVFGPVLLGALVGVFFCRRLIRYIKNIFHV